MMDFQSNSHSNANSCLEQFPLAMAYVPFQRWDCLYELPKGFQKGTIFPDLDKPFCCAGGSKPWRR